MNEGDFSFFMSEIEILVRCSVPEVMAQLRAVWSGCRYALRPTERQIRIDVRSDSKAYEIWQGETLWSRVENVQDVVPLLEARLYDEFVQWLDAQVVPIHAATCILDDVPVVLVGGSGSGKSSLALELVRRGLTYVTDEITLTDGKTLWGVARAIQFDIQPQGAPLIDRLSEADLDTYRMRTKGGIASLPLIPVSVQSMVRRAVSVEKARIVFPEESAPTRLTSCSAVEALAEIHGAAFREPSVDLGRFVGPGRCYRLGWEHPGTAAELLLARVLDVRSP